MLFEDVKFTLKDQVNAMVEWQWHRDQRRKAERVYAYLLEENPNCALSNSTERRIKEYAIEGLGSKLHAPWLRVYAAFAGRYEDGWMPGNYFSRTVAPAVTLRTSAGAKSMILRVLQHPSIPDVAYYVNRFWLDRENQDIARDRIIDTIFADSDSIIVKVDRSFAGKGVFKIPRANFDIDRIESMGDVVFQRPIVQHADLNRFCGGNVATVRITTVKLPGQPARNRGGHIRFGRDGSDIVKVDEHLRAPVEDEATGTLGARGNGKRWRTFDAHPDTGERFGGAIIPGYADAVKLCEGLHNRHPLSMIIGWDIAIGPEAEPIIMEWNLGRVGIRYMEAAQGPCFRDTGWQDIWKEVRAQEQRSKITADPGD